MKYHAIIVAGGKGSRMGSAVPKQFMELGGLPVLMHTLKRFRQALPAAGLILVMRPGDQSLWEDLCKKYGFTLSHRLVEGGETRFHSVQNGLEAIRGEEGVIGVHDGVRPLLSQELIRKCFGAAAEQGTAIPVIKCQDSIRRLQGRDSVPASRNEYVLVQTPQCFKAEIIQKAYHQPFREEFTDDASVVENAGTKIHLVAGEKFNIKITYPTDLRIAAAILS